MSLDEHSESLTLSDKEMIKMVEYLQRYLACFRIYGFDLNGHEVVIIEDKNPMEERALQSLVEEHCYGDGDIRMLGEDEPYCDDEDSNEL